MTWRYRQSSGDLSYGGVVIGRGYAGFGEGVNNPADEAIANIGPIPVGFYTIGPAFTHPTTGSLTMRLIPQPGTDMHGRDGFLMHGDSAALNHTASHGCIVQRRDVRATVAASDDRTLEVVA